MVQCDFTTIMANNYRTYPRWPKRTAMESLTSFCLAEDNMIICEGYKTPEAYNNLMKLRGMLHGRRIVDGCDFTLGFSVCFCGVVSYLPLSASQLRTTSVDLKPHSLILRKYFYF